MAECEAGPCRIAGVERVVRRLGVGQQESWWLCADHAVEMKAYLALPADEQRRLRGKARAEQPARRALPEVTAGLVRRLLPPQRAALESLAVQVGRLDSSVSEALVRLDLVEACDLMDDQEAWRLTRRGRRAHSLLRALDERDDRPSWRSIPEPDPAPAHTPAPAPPPAPAPRKEVPVPVPLPTASSGPCVWKDCKDDSKYRWLCNRHVQRARKVGAMKWWPSGTERPTDAQVARLMRTWEERAAKAPKRHPRSGRDLAAPPPPAEAPAAMAPPPFRRAVMSDPQLYVEGATKASQQAWSVFLGSLLRHSGLELWHGVDENGTLRWWVRRPHQPGVEPVDLSGRVIHPIVAVTSALARLACTPLLAPSGGPVLTVAVVGGEEPAVVLEAGHDQVAAAGHLLYHRVQLVDLGQAEAGRGGVRLG